MSKFEQAQAAYNTFLNDMTSIILATCDAEGVPNASYAPFIYLDSMSEDIDDNGEVPTIDQTVAQAIAQATDQEPSQAINPAIAQTTDQIIHPTQRRFYIYVSGLSTHTQNIAVNPRVSLMAIEDEQKTQQIFARCRLTFDCVARTLERETPHWEKVVTHFADRFGQIIELFRPLTDFRVVELIPQSGRFVYGFGAAYDIAGTDLKTLIHVTGEGKGHRNAS